MIYIMSDIHGEFDLFCRMLRHIKFIEGKDKIIIAGDIIDKGNESCALLDYISKINGIIPILGNHELDFLKEVRSLTRGCRSDGDYDEVLSRLAARFPDGHLLTWELVEYIESWDTVYEEEDFVVIHAGLPLDESGIPLPIEDSTPEQIVNDRRFRNAKYRGKTAFFGHTHTPNGRIVGYVRGSDRKAERLSDYSKIWLDCGAWHNGTLGAFCIDNMKCYYVHK